MLLPNVRYQTALQLALQLEIQFYDNIDTYTGEERTDDELIDLLI
jgi:hypothetical protein